MGTRVNAFACRAPLFWPCDTGTLTFWAYKFIWSEETQILKSRGKNINYLCTGKRKMEKTINESLNRNIKECRDVLNIMLSRTLVVMNAVSKQGNGN